MVYITLVGLDHYYGKKPFSVGKSSRRVKERDNEFDSEKIRTVAYVTNSPNGVICMVLEG